MKYETFEKRAVGIAAILICIFLGLCALYLFFKFGFSIILPFLIGWLIALAIVPLSKKLVRKGERRQKAVSVILLIGFLALALFLISLGLRRLIFEVQRLLERLSIDSANISGIISETLDFVESITEHIPFLDRLTSSEELLSLRNRIDSAVSGIITGLVSDLGTRIPQWIGAIIGALPSIMLFLLVTLISSFYFCLDLGGIHRAIENLLPTRISEKLNNLKRRAGGTALKYLRAYLLILYLTFGELFIGFSVLGIEYALLLAVIIAFIDILPVFGVGSVLIPWSAVLLISGNYYHGIGLLIIYACVTIVRQISEPKIVGGSLGLHPLLTLVSIYAGFKLFGFIGMIFGPAVMLALKSILFQQIKSV
ncbi:MAG: sporulation integral membrane protein YtvI [Clostridia bacterium]|nr:sporulation integral membrane protein YtvI [Clostridia bacterium]